MTSIVPPLDTIDFDRLVEAARSHIPRFAPEWTDHNLHDPGMTLIDLLAWIVDQQVYRVGFVGDRHLEAFAALLGQRPRGPRPAVGLVWPDQPLPHARSLVAGVDVIYLAQPELGFELQHAVFVTETRLRGSWLVSEGAEVRVSEENRTAGSVLLAPRAPGATAQLLVRLDGPLVSGDRPEPVSVGFDVVPPPGQPPPPVGRAQAPTGGWGPLAFDYRIGTGDWIELEVVDDGTAGLSRTGAVILRVPGGPESDAAEVRLSLDRGFFPIAPQLRHVAINVLPIVQRSTVPAARLADGTGLPDETVPVDTRDLLVGPGVPPFTIRVGGVPWTERPDFDESGPDDNHYVRHPDRLVFGNGVNGRRPPAMSEIRHDVFVRTEGASGNVRAGSAWRVPALGRHVERFGRNHAALAGGADRSSLDMLLSAARTAATERDVLLTDDDLVTAAFGLPGLAVARAEVVSGFDPALPDGSLDGVRTLVVIPHRQPEVEFDGVSDTYVGTIRSALDEHRVLGERLIVVSPRIVFIDVELRATIEPGAVADTVRHAIVTALRNRLSDVRRADDAIPWPLGRPVTVMELTTTAANVEGVMTVPTCRIAREGEALGEQSVEIARDAVAIALAPRVTVDVGGGLHR
jgi:hypothetical protein